MYLIQDAKTSRYVAIALVIFISTLLATRPLGLGLDDENYLEYFNNAKAIISRYEGLSYIFNEPLWLMLSLATGSILGDEGSLRLVIFASSVFAGIGLARMNRWALLPIVLYFTLPVSLKNHVDHLRQGFTVGIYILFFSVHGRWRMLRFFTPLFHASFWVVIVTDALLAWYYRNHLNLTRSDCLKILMAFTCASVVLAIGLVQIATTLGFRQADIYSFMPSEGSGAAFIGWLVLLPLMFVLANRQYFGHFAAYLGLYLGGYYFSPVVSRIFENSFFFLCSAAPTWSRNHRIIFWVILIALCIVFGYTGNLYPRLLGLTTI